MQKIKDWFDSEIAKHLMHYAEGIVLGFLAAKGFANPAQLNTLTDAVQDPKVIAASLAVLKILQNIWNGRALTAAMATGTAPAPSSQAPITEPLRSPHMMPAIALACLLAFSFTAKAQDTTSTKTPPAATGLATNTVVINTNLIPVVSAAANWFASIRPYLTNSAASFDVGPLYSVHSQKFGLWGAVKVPVNDILSLGFECMSVNNDVFYGPFSAQIGKTINTHVIGNIYAYAESGPTLQFGKGATLGAQSFAGFQKKWDISPRLELMVGGGTGNITGESGLIVSAQVALSWKWSK